MGNAMGSILRTLFFPGAADKSVSDTDAYDFLTGYFDGSKDVIDFQLVYDNI